MNSSGSRIYLVAGFLLGGLLGCNIAWQAARIMATRETAVASSPTPVATATAEVGGQQWKEWGEAIYKGTSSVMGLWADCVEGPDALRCHDETFVTRATMLLDEIRFKSPFGSSPDASGSECGQGLRQLQLALEYAQVFGPEDYEYALLHFDMAQGALRCDLVDIRD